MFVYILLIMLLFWIPMLFPSFIRRHFYNDIRIIFGGMIYFVPYMILIQSFPQADDLLKLYLLLMGSFFLGTSLGKIMPPLTFENGQKSPFNGSLVILIVVYSLLFWVLTNLDIADYGKYAGVIGLPFVSGIKIRQDIIEKVTKT